MTGAIGIFLAKTLVGKPTRGWWDAWVFFVFAIRFLVVPKVDLDQGLFDGYEPCCCFENCVIDVITKIQFKSV